MGHNHDRISVRGRRRKQVNFNPNREYLETAVEDFIKKGGKIRKIATGPGNDCYNLYHTHTESSGIEEYI